MPQGALSTQQDSRSSLNAGCAIQLPHRGEQQASHEGEPPGYMTDVEETLEPARRGEGQRGAARAGLLAELTRTIQRMWTDRPPIAAGAAVFVMINLVLLGAYLWSRGGQTTHVRLEAEGDQFAAYVDDRLMVESTFAGAERRGGIILSIGSGPDHVPSLPSPGGIDSVRVTDLADGRVLFEDDFSLEPDERWVLSRQTFDIDSGVFSDEGAATLSLLDMPWRDYALDVAFKNIDVGQIAVRAGGPSSVVAYSFRPFRHFDNTLLFRELGQPPVEVTGPPIQLSKVETAKSMVAMALHPYPLALQLLAIGVIAVGGLQFAHFLGASRLSLRLPRASSDLPGLTVAGIVGGTFGVLLFLNRVYGSSLPHVPDSVSYIFQAKVLASGHLSVSPPPVREVFDFFFPPFIVQSGDRWASIYPFGHPLLLAIGVRIGAIWLIPPLVGAATVGMIYLLGQKVYRTRVGLLAALLLASSPFFLMTASNFMAHNTAAFYIVASLLCLAFIDKRPVLFGVLAGVFFGLAFNTRILTTTALMLPFGVYLLSLLVPRERRALGALQVSAFLIGGLLMLGAYWFYNWGTTGDPFTNGYQQAADVSSAIGFGERHSFTISTQHEQTQLALLLLVLNGWPQYIGLLFVLLPFVLGTRHRWDWLLLTSAVFIMAAYVLFRGNGVMHGPRYWYEATPFLILLAARGADHAADVLASGTGWLRQTLFGTGEGAAWAGAGLSYALALALVGASIYGWLLSQHSGWQARFAPDQAVDLQGFNFIDNRLVRLVDDADLDDALVLVEACPNWWCYGNVFWMNAPTLDGDVVFARNIEARHAELFRAYPDRKVYVATYTRPSLRPYAGRVSLDGSRTSSAPLAKDIILPTPPTTP